MTEWKPHPMMGYEALLDPYAPQQPPSGLDVLEACEVLLRAGYTAEALSVLQETMPCEMKAIAKRMMSNATTHDQG